MEGAHEIEERNGWSLKYHKGRPGGYVGVTKRVGKRKTSYIARLSHTKRKGDERRLYRQWRPQSRLRRPRPMSAVRSLLRATESPAHVRTPLPAFPLPFCLTARV